MRIITVLRSATENLAKYSETRITGTPFGSRQRVSLRGRPRPILGLDLGSTFAPGIGVGFFSCVFFWDSCFPLLDAQQGLQVLSVGESGQKKVVTMSSKGLLLLDWRKVWMMMQPRQ